MWLRGSCRSASLGPVGPDELGQGGGWLRGSLDAQGAQVAPERVLVGQVDLGIAKAQGAALIPPPLHHLQLQADIDGGID